MLIFKFCIRANLDGDRSWLQEVSWPQKLRSHRDSSERDGDTAAGVKGGVEVVGVMEDVTADEHVQHGQQHGETAKAKQQQQRRLSAA